MSIQSYEYEDDRLAPDTQVHVVYPHRGAYDTVGNLTNLEFVESCARPESLISYRL